MTARLVHVRSYTRRTSPVPSRWDRPIHDRLLGEVLAMELERVLFTDPELQRIETENPAQARRIAETW